MIFLVPQARATKAIGATFTVVAQPGIVAVEAPLRMKNIHAPGTFKTLVTMAALIHPIVVDAVLTSYCMQVVMAVFVKMPAKIHVAVLGVAFQMRVFAVFGVRVQQSHVRRVSF